MLIVVAGTATEVGKTYVATALLHELRRCGVDVAARKLAQSFAVDSTEPTDADLLAAASNEAVERVCPRHRWYERAMAPPMAAAALGRAGFTIADLVAELDVPDGTVTLIETAGGVRSPLAEDGDAVTLCERVAPDLVIVVADAGLGTINAVRLATAALAGFDVIVVLNRYDERDELHRANADWLRTRDGLDVVTDIEAVAARINQVR